MQFLLYLDHVYLYTWIKMIIASQLFSVLTNIITNTHSSPMRQAPWKLSEAKTAHPRSYNVYVEEQECTASSL